MISLPALAIRPHFTAPTALHLAKPFIHSSPQLQYRALSKMSDSKKNGDITSFADKADGQYKRQVSSFRDHIEPNGKFPPEKGRYHLYVSLACPWAHRTLLGRGLKGLDDYIGVTVVHPHMLQGGWHFVTPENAKKTPAPQSEHSFDTFPGADADPFFGVSYLSELYRKAVPDYNARFTVPILWDKQQNTIVNNESSEILRDLNSGFNSILPDGEGKELDLYPEELRKEIDEINDWVYNDLNNGVYKSGFASKQEAYEEHVVKVAKALERLDEILSDGREFLVGGRLTEVDIRTYTTVVRYDPVYHGHFKCNLGSIRHDYPNVHLWLRRLYWNNPVFKDTTNFEHIKEHYYYSHAQINPTRIVPLGPNPNIEPLDSAGQKRGPETDAEGTAKKSK